MCVCDIVLMKVDLSKIPLAINISSYTKNYKTKFNVCDISLSINLIIQCIWTC